MSCHPPQAGRPPIRCSRSQPWSGALSMTTTPTLWGTEDPLFPFTTDALPKVAALKDGTVDMVRQRAGGDLVGRHLNELGGLPCGDFLSALSSSTDMTLDRTGGTVMIRPTPRNIGLAAAAAMVLA